MKGFLELEDSIFCILGTLPEERVSPQKIIWHLRYELELPQLDSLLETIDYSEVKKQVRKVAIEGKYQLLEILAQKVLDSLFQTFPMLSATLRLKKEQYGSTVEVSR